jgi:hypothetical protein
MKAVLSQTIFCGGAHIHGKVGGRLLVDLDSNGWPQSGRNRALKEMRKAFAVHIAGDQHLGTVFHHGIKDWNDAVYSFCVPSIANLYLRWWDPLEPGRNRTPGAPTYTGEFQDGLGNKVTCLAVANPSQERNGGSKLTTRAAGFGIVRFNKKTREITFECWPRHSPRRETVSGMARYHPAAGQLRPGRERIPPRSGDQEPDRSHRPGHRRNKRRDRLHPAHQGHTLPAQGLPGWDVHDKGG